MNRVRGTWKWEFDEGDMVYLEELARIRNHPWKGGKGYSNNSFEDNLLGLQGEAVVSKLVGRPFIQHDGPVGDGDSHDIEFSGVKLQVKQNRYDYGDLYINEKAEFVADVGVLVVPAGDLVVRMCGWVTRGQFYERCIRKSYRKEFGEVWAVDQKELNPMDSFMRSLRTMAARRSRDAKE